MQVFEKKIEGSGNAGSNLLGAVSNPLSNNLIGESYTIYIVHYNFLIIFQVQMGE